MVPSFLCSVFGGGTGRGCAGKNLGSRPWRSPGQGQESLSAAIPQGHRQVQLTKVGLVGTSLELHSSGAGLYQEMPHQLLGHVPFLILLHDAWRRGRHLHGQPIGPPEGVAVADDEGPWLLILEKSDGLLSGDLGLVPVLGSVLDKLHLGPCLGAIV